MARIAATLRALIGRRRWERDLDDELQAHLDERAAHLIRTGIAPAAARRRARLELGSAEAYKEECRRSFGLRRFDELRQDVRYALRTLRCSPGFAAVAVLSLALGIGANTAVFSLVNAIVLRPLPIGAPDRVFMVQNNGGPTHSFPVYRYFRDQNSTFDGLAAYRIAPIGLETPAGPRRVWGYLASGNYFDVLGVQPALGRFFHAGDDTTPGASPYAVLSFTAWRARFGGDPAIVGRTVAINRMPYTVLGVAPEGFFGTELFYTPEIWVPMMMQPQIEGHSWLDERATLNTWVVGRLKPGVTPRQAEANLQTLAVNLGREFPATDSRLKESLASPGLIGDTLRGPAEAFLLGVMALAALVLLAACANLASLLTARTNDRFFELAIRLSIGAGRGRLLRQLLTEAMALAAIGGAAGCALAYGLLRAIAAAGPPVEFTRLNVTPDWRVLLFAFGASAATGLVFGTAPARRGVSADPNGALRGGVSGSSGHRRWKAREILLAGQVALCCFLVTAAFVSVRGLSRAVNTATGFDPRGLDVVAFDLGLAKYSRTEGEKFQRRALDALAALPGVTDAAYGNSIPLFINQSTSGVYREGSVAARMSDAIPATHYNVSPGYFRTMRMRLLSGREFTWHDDRNAPPVAVVNLEFARRVIGTADAVGRRFREGIYGSVYQVVGVAEQGKYRALAESPEPVFFRCAAQNYDDSTVVLVRSRLPEAEVIRQLRETMKSLDPQLPLYALGDVRQMTGLTYYPARAATVALSAFGALALMLAVTGIYGLSAYTVSRRVREIGIRVAVGAQPWQVLRSILGRTGALLAAGSAAGLALGAVSTRLLASIVYQATPRDPLVLAAVAVTMAAVALGAAWAPARRAISVDPLRSLRHE
jgi:predicted permease